MADNNETSTLKLDLDNKEFLEKALKSKSAIEKIGDADNLTGMLEGLAKCGVALGVMGAAVFAVKEAMDLVFDAEKIQKINDQFELLTKNAGVAGNEIKEGLVKAVQGLATESDSLQAANRAVVELGKNADRIPEIMDLARKATSVFGGNLIDNFNNMSQAIASGHTRMLAHLGIVINSDKALRDYAASIGKFKDDLTDAEKKTAMLNAALDKGGEAFKGIKPPADNATTTMQQFKTAMGEASESIVLLASKYIKPVLMPVLKELKETFESLNIYLKKDMGEGTELLNNRMEFLKARINAVRDEMDGIKNSGPHLNFKTGIDESAESLERLRHEYTELLKESSSVKAKLNKSEGDEELIDDGGGSKKPSEDDSKSKTALKFNEDLIKLKEQRIRAEEELDTNYDELQQHRAEELTIMHQQMMAKIAMIDEEYRLQGKAGSESNLEARKEVLDKYAADVQKLNLQIMNDNQKVADQAVKSSISMTAAFANGWKKASADSGTSIQKFAKLGEAANNALSNSIVAGAKAAASGSEDAADAMKKAFFGYLGERAMYAGAEMIAESVWPPNALGLAGGAALVALGAELSAISGSGSSAPSTSGGGGGSPSFQAQEAAPGPITQDATTGPKKHVEIQIHGNYYDTNDTRKTLMDMIRQETDNTGYTYVQINPGS